VPPLEAAVVSGAVAALAWRAGALRLSGAVAAAALGAVVLAAAGWPGGLILMAFFLPSTAVSRLWPAPVSSMDAKDDRRDGWQVLANGGVPTLALALGGPGGSVLAFAAGLATAAADTWATAVGAHSRTPPRHILRGYTVVPGTSGGITTLGTAGAAIGAALVALAAAPLLGWRGASITFGIGVGGMLLDSALGAGLQGRFRCDECQVESERRVHRCGRPTRFLGGCQWLSNDGVNALATAAATLAGWAAWRWCCPA
jgi:uncharacterized protein (TIGR00297 family)